MVWRSWKPSGCLLLLRAVTAASAAVHSIAFSPRHTIAASQHFTIFVTRDTAASQSATCLARLMCYYFSSSHHHLLPRPLADGGGAVLSVKTCAAQVMLRVSSSLELACPTVVRAFVVAALATSFPAPSRACLVLGQLQAAFLSIAVQQCNSYPRSGSSIAIVSLADRHRPMSQHSARPLRTLSGWFAFISTTITPSSSPSRWTTNSLIRRRCCFCATP